MNEVERRNNDELIRAMHTVVQNMNTEHAEMAWSCYLPYDATDDDFEGIAGDAEEMDAASHCFRRIIGWWGKDGWFTNHNGEPPFEVYGNDEE